jgi:hypothetical protein
VRAARQRSPASRADGRCRGLTGSKALAEPWWPLNPGAGGVTSMRHRNLRAHRDAGLRRLSRLTWRAALLSLVTAFGIATLFAKTAVHYVSTTSPGTQSSAGQTATGSSASSGASVPSGASPSSGQAAASSGAASAPTAASSGGTTQTSQPTAGATTSKPVPAPTTLAPPTQPPTPAPTTTTPAPTKSSSSKP